VARLAHQVGEGGAVFAPGGEQAAAQGVAGEPLGLQACISGSQLDQPSDRLVGQALAGDPPDLGDGARTAGVQRGTRGRRRPAG
jgi:hypothetical protein